MIHSLTNPANADFDIGLNEKESHEIAEVLGLKPAPEFEAWLERRPPLIPEPWLLT